MNMLLRSSGSLLLAGLLFSASTASAGVVTYNKNAQQSLADATGGLGPHTPATTTSTLAFLVPSTLGQVIDVDVRVHLNHPNLRQLRVVLAAPNGTTVTLMENGINAAGNFIFGANNASGANLEDAFFDQDTRRPITDGIAPYSARFAAEMNVVENRTPAQSSGTWELRITDYRAGDTGTLVSWSISLKSADSAKTFTVTNLSNSGAGSLRDAIAQANANVGDNTIVIDQAVAPGSIVLQAPMEIIASHGETTLDLGNPRSFVILGNGNRIFTVSAGIVNIRNVTLQHGFTTAAEGGGAIFNAAQLDVEQCTLRGNSVHNTAGPPLGGAVANVGNLSVSDSTFVANSAGFGGAIYTERGQANIRTCTFDGNLANYGPEGSGGAIHAASGRFFISFSTLSGNASTGKGGGITSGGPTVDHFLQNSIVAGNDAPTGPDLYGEFHTYGCVIGDGSDATLATSSANQVGTASAPIDPRLNPLANNGGPTNTMALQFGSPALDAGVCPGANGFPAPDQRGGRVVDLLSVGTSDQFSYECDCGAFELNPAVFANISTRLPVATGENVLIAGFIITTTPLDSSTKNVLARGIGPSLQAAGLTGTLADPVLELYNSGGLLVSNNNWRDSQQAEIQATTIPPASDLESAIVRELNAASYTAILRGKDGGTGIGLVELYDLGIQRNVVVANVSTRGFVRTGQDVMIGGFILVGTDPAKILVRGIGPSLTGAGIQQTLPDPFLELFDGQGNKIAQNDNWQDTQANVITATGAAPTNTAESAILITLPAGSYTAIVSGVGGGMGVALVEAYNIR